MSGHFCCCLVNPLLIFWIVSHCSSGEQLVVKDFQCELYIYSVDFFFKFTV